MAVRQKDLVAVTLERRGSEKGGFARAAKLTSEQRSESARKPVQARWAKAKEGSDLIVVKGIAIKTSDNALLSLLKRIKTTDDPAKIKRLSDQLERVIFRKKFDTA